MTEFLHEMVLSHPLLLYGIMSFLAIVGGLMLAFGLWVEAMR